MNQDQPRLELWIHDIQSYLDKVFSRMMDQAGFTFDKLNYSYQRRLGRNLQTFGFIFINQYPTNHRISFIMHIRNSYVRDIKSSFFKLRHLNDSQLSSLLLFMRNFKENELSQTSFDDYPIINNNDLFVAVEDILKILDEKALPLCDRLTNIMELDNFYESHPEFSVNSINLDNMISDLAICKIVGRRNINQLYSSMIESIEDKINRGHMADHSARILSEFHDFLMKK